MEISQKGRGGWIEMSVVRWLECLESLDLRDRRDRQVFRWKERVDLRLMPHPVRSRLLRTELFIIQLIYLGVFSPLVDNAEVFVISVSCMHARYGSKTCVWIDSIGFPSGAKVIWNCGNIGFRSGVKMWEEFIYSESFFFRGERKNQIRISGRGRFPREPLW